MITVNIHIVAWTPVRFVHRTFFSPSVIYIQISVLFGVKNPIQIKCKRSLVRTLWSAPGKLMLHATSDATTVWSMPLGAVRPLAVIDERSAARLEI